MERLVAEPLFYIFFVYGASFLLMGYLVLKGARNAAAGPLVFSFYLLALFGLTHGITEMTDWVRFILKTVGAGEVRALTYLSQVCLVLSFLVLVQFGLSLLTYRLANRTVVMSVPVVLLVLFLAVIIGRGATDILRIGLLVRYSFGFGGSLLSAVALLMASDTMKHLGNRKLVKGMNIAAASFACYAVFGGLIISPIAGAPIQLFRAACAVAVAFSAFAILDVYKYVKSRDDMPANAAHAVNS